MPTLLVLVGLCLSGYQLRAGSLGADAVVIINSKSVNYLDFQHYLQPYLDNFGTPYTVLDIASNPVPADIGRHALIIIGHGQLDTNQVFLTGAAQSNIVTAVSLGSGLVNFDASLTNGVGTNGYAYVQNLFGFGYGTASNATNITFPVTENSNLMHYITALHTTNDSLVLTNNLTVPGLTFGSKVTAIALSGGAPLVTITKYGLGRAVQFGSYAWMDVSVLGPVNGMDDVVWRSLVWAARKPFVLRGMPNFATMRVDDVSGPFDWTHTVNQVGFKPFLGVFFSNISSNSASDLRGIVTNGNATTSIHSFTDSYFFYYDDANATSYSDSVMSNNFALGTQWHITNGIPISKMMIAHWSEIGLNAFAGLKAWGIEYVLIEDVPGTREYYAPYPPWLTLGPYRLYEPPLQGQSLNPMAYADFLPISGHPEFNGVFFDPYTEIRNVLPSPSYNVLDGGDWAPDPYDVSGSIYRATQQIKRGLDSMTLGNVFTHERYINEVNAVSTNAWLAILQGVTNNLAPYHPAYVTMDYANQYLRATRTSRLNSSSYDAGSGNVNVGLTGKTDLNISVQVYTGQGSSITNLLGTVPIFNGSTNFTATTVAPMPLPILQGMLQSNQFVMSFNTVPWQSYIVCRASSINPGVWSVVTNFTATGTNAVCSDSIYESTQCFYRVLLGTSDAGPLTLTANAQGGQFLLRFNSRIGASYAVQFANAPGSAWSLLTNITALTTNTSVSDPLSGSQRIYRVSTPNP